ncbi:MAG: MotA/TolQ/ExbB proton channel family protein [Prevotellaceae bacterium]|jgi:biopolymer transport protein ExbB|nr:MotA/TolQ/ExbB proton channel family protein [Prevotellaceae bacterium]
MEKTKKTGKSKALDIFAGAAIVICIAVGFLMWRFVMGAPANFEGGDPVNGHPLPGNFLGQIYKGGVIVPFLMGLLLMAVVFSIERFFAISKAEGKGNLGKFVNEVQASIAVGNVDEAMEQCNVQKGSVANVINSALVKYKDVRSEGFDSEKASEMIQTEIENATSLEMPTLEKNMPILATLVSIGTLLGLLGTVSGMIKAFAGLAVSGTPDQAQLANGISEALINTATGISTSILSIIAYNFFTSKIDTLTSFIDEAGAAITKSYRRLKSK